MTKNNTTLNKTFSYCFDKNIQYGTSLRMKLSSVFYCTSIHTEGSAISIAMCGSGVGGLVISNVCQAVMISVGYRWSIRVAGFISFFFLSLATIFVKQSPAQLIKRKESPVTLRGMFSKQKMLLKSSQFNIFMIISFLTTFGYLVPSFLLPCK